MKNKRKSLKKFAIIVPVILGFITITIGNFYSSIIISTLRGIRVDTYSAYPSEKNMIELIFFNLSMMTLCTFGIYAIWRPKKYKRKD